MLQNHYGDHEHPVRPRARYARHLQQAHAAPLSNRAAAHRLRRAAPALAVFTVLLLAQDWLSPLLPTQLRPSYLVLVALILIPVMLITLAIEGLSYRWLPLREQRRYRQLTGAPDVSAHQQQLLALDAQSDYAAGAWNSSLEYAPSWRCLPEQVRRTWEPQLITAGTPRTPSPLGPLGPLGPRATPGTSGTSAARGVPSRPKVRRPLFRTLPMASVAAQRAEIDARYHVASGRDVELYVADLLNITRSTTQSTSQNARRSAGGSDGSSTSGAGGPEGISARFAAAAAGPHGDQMVARVASLTGRDEFELRALTEPVGGRSPQLLCGADVQWAISMVRLCYCAEHIDEATAWELIEGAGAVAAAQYGSWQEYWASVRTGVAFGSDSLDAVQRFDASLMGLQADEWPAARLPWLRSLTRSHGAGVDPGTARWSHRTRGVG